MTNNLLRRGYEHRNGLIDGFTKKYNLKILVYIEVFNRIEDAIHREKRLKKWNRQWKIDLIEKDNPDWADLYEQLVNEARHITDFEMRMKQYQKADRLLMEEAILCPLTYWRTHLLVKPWLQRFPISPISWWFWKDVVIEPH